MNGKDATKEAAVARAKHRFLVKGLIFIAVLAALVGIVLGFFHPRPLWVPKPTAGGKALEAK